MREFEKFEMYKTKCPVCGSKNKVHTELMNQDNKFVGYSLKCCNCGNYNRFLLDYNTNGKRYQTNYTDGKQRCIQPSYCPRKDCALYGTCTMNLNDVDFNDKPQDIQDSNVESTVHIEVLHSPRFL